MRWWHLVLRLVIGGVFVWAGASKALDPAGFADAIEGYQLLPHTGAVALALYLPWLEIICGVALIVGRLSRGAMGLLSFLLLVFMSALVSAWWRELDVECGCFGGSVEAVDYLWPIARDVLLLAGLVVLILSQRTLPKSDPNTSV